MKFIFIKKLIKENHAAKKISNYVAAFDYIDKILIVLSAISGGVCIISSTSVAGAPIGRAGASFNLIFSLTIGIVTKLKKLLSTTRKKEIKQKQTKA